jgi:hypothetical protein
MASLLEAQAFLDQFDKCLPLCERGNAVTVINALHTLNNITQASISQVKELNPSNGHDLFCSFLLELELALELYISPTRKLGTIDGGLPALYAFSDEDLASLSSFPSLSTKSKVKRFLEALDVPPSSDFEVRSVAATVMDFLKCQVKKSDAALYDTHTRGRTGCISSTSSPVPPGTLKPISISWADQCSSGSESDLDDMPPLEDGDDDLAAPNAKTPSPPPSLPAEEHLAAEDEYADDIEEDDWCSDEYDEDRPPRDEAAFTFLFATPVSRHGDYSDDHDAPMGLCRPTPEEGYGMCGKGVRAAPAVRAVDSFYKTRMCKNWEQTGTCLYAGRCNFAHGEEELRSASGTAAAPASAPAPAASTQAVSPTPASRPSTRRQIEEESERPAQLYKTRMCKNFEQNGSCKFGEKCNFAHGKEELRRGGGAASTVSAGRSGNSGSGSAATGFKKRLCERFAGGSCLYGSRCTFAHGAEDLQ